ncbi:EAL domain-containing protein [Aurantiacibacter spongiae]
MPVDQFIWTLQSRLAEHRASGDIVFVGAERELADADFPERRTELANILDKLRKAGVGDVYVDVVFDRPGTPADDARLRRALENLGSRAHLTKAFTTDFDGRMVARKSIPKIGKGISEVGSYTWMNVLGYAWYMPYRVPEISEDLPTLPAAIAGDSGDSSRDFPISYAFSLDSIPSYRIEDLEGANEFASFAGKSVVIGQMRSGDMHPLNIPGHVGIPTSYASIFAAETLKASQTVMIDAIVPIITVFLLLLSGVIVRSVWLRYTAYGVSVLLVPAFLAITAEMAIRANTADAVALLAIFAAFRIRARWKRNLRLVDGETGLPTFLALETDKDVAEHVPAIIVARIQRFQEVRRTLPTELHIEYLLSIVSRLRAATQDAEIYLGEGHLIAWTMAEKDPTLLREHLEGLRALFSSPLVVGDEQVDVGITFGIDLTPSPAVSRRLSAAVAAAEKTTETFEPIAIVDAASQEDLLWNISLQARIDQALASGEIYLAFQPKILVQTGEIIGVEALVRWSDPVRGQIPPDHFIRQCETAGRMGHLTRYVLEQACMAGNAFEDNGLNIPVAVNISATLLHEREIVSMVREALDKTGFEPRRLTLEITETFRISNLDVANEILAELGSLGTKISMDDFGVGAASLEALLRLPFDELKIDRMFTARICDDPKALGIVRSVLQLGRDLRIIVVAEGVEDAETLTKLRENGCLVAQGFGIFRPDRIEKIIESQGLEQEPLRNMV